MARNWCPSTSAVAFCSLVIVFYLGAGAAYAAPQVAGEVVGSIPTQPPPRDRVQAAQPAGTGHLTVQVIAADSGSPVKRANVQLIGLASPGAAGSRAPDGAGSMTSVIVSSVQIVGPGGPATMAGRVQRAGETDASGQVEFVGLPSASYMVSVNPSSGYVRPQQTASVQLKDGEDRSLTVRLDRAGAITGRILDDTGDPIARVQVRAMRRMSVGGTPRLGSSGGASTDDLGQFRIFDLAPGDYYVSAFYRSMYSGDPMMATTGPRTGFVPTYYPNAISMDTARPVHVAAGQDTPGVDLALLRGRLGRVLGTATDSSGTPVGGGRGGSVSLSTRREDQVSSGFGAAVRPDGTFVMNDVPPGDYYLVAMAMRGEGPAAEREGAYVPVTVNGDDVMASIQTNTGATLSGRIVVEGTMPPPAAAGAVPGANVVSLPGGRGAATSPRLSIGVRPATQVASMAFASGKSAVANESNTFEITGVRGSVTLTAAGSLGTLKEVRRGGDDVTGTPLELTGTERVNDLVIVLTNDVGTVSGSVTNDSGDPANGAWVIVFPDNPNRWYPGSPFVRPTRTGSPAVLSSAAPGAAVPAGLAAGASAQGSPAQFTVPRLVAGRYLVVAVEGTDSVSMVAYDAETLTKLRPQATSVTVTPGQTVNVELRTVKRSSS